MTDKRPKVPPILLDIVIDCIAAFGCTTSKTVTHTSSYTSVLLKECISNIFPTVLINSTSGNYNKPTRDSCMNLLIAVCRYMSYKDPISAAAGGTISIPAPIQVAIIANMKPALKSDFDKLLAVASSASAVPTTIGAPVAIIGIPTVYLRKDRAALQAKEAAANAAASVSSGNIVGSGVPGAGASTALGNASQDGADMREYLPEIDFLKKMKGDMALYHSKIGDLGPSATGTPAVPTKWSEQVEGLQIIVNHLGASPKCKPLGSYTDASTEWVQSILKEGILDVLKYYLSAHNSSTTHITLQVLAIKIYTLLADGYRQEFTSYARSSIQSLLAKYKDKKLCSVVSICLLTYFKYCPGITIADMMDDWKELIINKKSPPHSIIGVLELISILIQENFPVDNKILKLEAYKSFYSDILVVRSEDSDVKIREACVNSVLLFAQWIKHKVTTGGTATKDSKVIVEVQKLMMSCQTSLPKLYKKLEGIFSGATVFTLPNLTSQNVINGNATTGGAVSAPAAATAPAATTAAAPTAGTAGGIKRPPTGTGASKPTSAKPAATPK